MNRIRGVFSIKTSTDFISGKLPLDHNIQEVKSEYDLIKKQQDEYSKTMEQYREEMEFHAMRMNQWAKNMPKDLIYYKRHMEYEKNAMNDISAKMKALSSNMKETSKHMHKYSSEIEKIVLDMIENFDDLSIEEQNECIYFLKNNDPYNLILVFSTDKSCHSYLGNGCTTFNGDIAIDANGYSVIVNNGIMNIEP